MNVSDHASADRSGAAASPGGAATAARKASHPLPAMPSLSMPQRFLLDPVGNSAAVLVLALMLGALVVVGAAWKGGVRLPTAPGWAIPTLALVGLGVAAYLAFVETTGTQAACGPVGNCNTVQQSDYSRLFGVLPVGMLGMLGYLAIGAVWLAGLLGPGRIRSAAWSGVRMLALVATIFSLYLTFLEPFVIGASCAWCLTSALVATLTLLSACSGMAEKPAGAVRQL